ncbi:hypothetical protein SAMN05421772_10346 [Paracoccus saliphilus]|uniref:Uncharacterized protein n=1 Tax=Paracoccus saliphilus TaxID=405559 RepID=A0AA46A4V2_9RHOB|nr:hypothetical protein SAMN05421772_10346 [Paracoccus saliphilus]
MAQAACPLLERSPAGLMPIAGVFAQHAGWAIDTTSFDEGTYEIVLFLKEGADLLAIAKA